MINAMNPPTRSTIRERIMQALKTTFEDDVSPDRVNWEKVTRSPPQKSDLQTLTTVLGIYDTSETIREGAGWEMRMVNVIFEFHVRLAEGDEPGTYLNHCLGSISNRIGEDIHMGGLAINTVEKGSELDIDGAFDKSVAGMIVFSVSYRCRPNDPYTPA